MDKRHNVYCASFLGNDYYRKRNERADLAASPFALCSQAIQTVNQTIIDHCEHRDWSLITLNVRSNHVHVIVQCGDVTPERALSQFKAWTTRKLREGGLVSKKERVWTYHGSTRYLWSSEDVRQAVKYVSDGQGPDL